MVKDRSLLGSTKIQNNNFTNAFQSLLTSSSVLNCLSFSLSYTKLVRAECVLTNVVLALADVVATKLGIIFFFFFFSSSFFPRTFLPEGVYLSF